MSAKTLLRRAVVCVALGAAMTAAAQAQYIYPNTGPLGSGSYLVPDLYHYQGPYGRYPNNYYNTLPRPPIGTYLPNQLPPPPPYAVPPTGLVPQPYPYLYQPPLYAPPAYRRPYYPPSFVRPRYYRYRGPYIYPQSNLRPEQPDNGPARREQHIAPVGEETFSDSQEEKVMSSW
jgi:hypothetical protein